MSDDEKRLAEIERAFDSGEWDGHGVRELIADVRAHQELRRKLREMCDRKCADCAHEHKLVYLLREDVEFLLSDDGSERG